MSAAKWAIFWMLFVFLAFPLILAGFLRYLIFVFETVAR
jgi:hypothetical protein